MLNWLHLTDLHWGLPGQRPLFPNVRHKFYDDLKRLLENCTTWDVIFFTGDLVQSGKKEEFDDLEAEFLTDLRDFLERELHRTPAMLAIPGNHDLDRRALDRFPAAARRLLDVRRLSAFGDLLFANVREDEYWQKSEYRHAIDAVFHNYTTWWTAHVEKTWKQYENHNKQEFGGNGDRVSVEKPKPGLLPGEFSTTIKCNRTDGEDCLIGVVGLNTTFLQLAGGDFRGKLSWDLRQLNAVCDNDVPEWVKRHDACILLTHQGPAWLTAEARDNTMYEINPPGRFAVHLFGHEHEAMIEAQSTLGGPLRNYWQCSSLFGLESFGEGSAAVERRHGYAAGRLDCGRGELKIWPRKATLIRGSGWKFLPDQGCVLGDDESLSQPMAQVSNSSWQAVELDQAQVDFTKELRKFGIQDEIIIRHIGLDMSKAKDRLLEMLRGCLRVKKISVELLVLSDDPKDFRDAPPAVRDWSCLVEESTSRIRDGIASLNQKLSSAGRTLQIEIRAYRETPTIHGFCLIKKAGCPSEDGRDSAKEEPIATYFAFCRWVASRSDESMEFKWGENSYWKITPERGDYLAKDMSEIFAGTFRHLWNEAERIKWKNNRLPWSCTIGVGASTSKTLRRGPR